MSFFSTVANVYGWHLSLGFACPSARISHSKTDQQVASTSWVCPKMGIPTIGVPLYNETYNSGRFCINTNLEIAVKQPQTAPLRAPWSCHSEVYVHNYTRDITATRPENFAELTEEEKALIKKLGVYIKDCRWAGCNS